MGLYSFIGRILPDAVRMRYKNILKYSTVKTKPDIFLGKIVVWGIVISLFFPVMISQRLDTPYSVLFFACFIVIEAAVYFWILLSANSKGNIVDEALPDALQLMSSNIRAGLTTDKALIMAARPEFGPLEKEIRRVGKETMAGKSLVESLKKMTQHIQSKDLERTVELIVHSIQSGGQLADLLDQTADDIRDQQMLRKEISASVLMYVMFIFIAIVIGAPVLFALSTFLIQMLTENMNMIAREMPADFTGGGAGLPISINESAIKPEFVTKYSAISIFVSCFFGSMVLGLIMTGEEKAGLRYLPLMLVVSFCLFVIARKILTTTLGDMITGG